MLTATRIFSQEFWTYEISGSIVSIYSIPMYIRADYHDNVWIKYEDKLICTPVNEEVAKHICLEHNANVLSYHKNNGNNHDIFIHFKYMIGFLAKYNAGGYHKGMSEIIDIPQDNNITYIRTNWNHWMVPRSIEAVYPKIIGTNQFINDCAYPNCSRRCERWYHCDLKVGE